MSNSRSTSSPSHGGPGPRVAGRTAAIATLLGLVATFAATPAATAAGSPAIFQPGQQAPAPAPAPLSDNHRVWLDEHVGYIITPREKEVFEQLSSDEERDLFIDAFWHERDPTPGTLRNEFKEEHERRVEYANRTLGRETPRSGWQTDRGRIYIQLGEPREIGRYYDPRGFWPMELWSYEANTRASGLPPFFYVLFYRPEMNGEYVIYDPFADGPGRLAKQLSLQMAEPRMVVRELLQGVGYEVAHASLSLNASERPDFASGSASPGNEILLARMGEAPFVGVDTGYTQVFLTHRGDVDASVVFDALEVGLTAMAFWDQRGMPFLHYAIQVPQERVMLAEYDEDYYLSLDVSLDVNDLRGTEVETGGDTLEEHFNQARAQQLIRAPLAYYDRLALVPGVYDVSIELINRVSDQGALARARMSVPEAPREGVILGDLLVASTVRQAPGQQQRAFQFEGRQFVPAVSGRVDAGSEIYLFAQLIAGFAAAPGDTVQITGTLVDAEGNEVENVAAVAVTPRPAPTPTHLTTTIPLTGVRPGTYTVRLTARLPDERMLSREKTLEVSAAGGARPPMVLLAAEAPANDVLDFQRRGNQHLRKGETAAAIAYFRAALEQDANAIGPRRLLAQALQDSGEHAEAARTIAPLAHSPSASAGDALLLSIALREAGEPTGAAETARALLSRWRPTPAAHNALGDALLDLGDNAGAAQAFRDSLALDPEQPDIRAKLERISDADGRS